MRIRKKSVVCRVVQSLLHPVLFMLVLCCFLSALGTVEKGHRKEEEKRIADVIKKAVVSCYATEGVYLATLEDVEERYGLVIDKQRYHVFYEVFADNIMPEITVVPKTK